MYSKILLLLLVLVTISLSIPDGYSMKISCEDKVDIGEFPICNYITEWNESEKFGELVLAELALRVDEINEDPKLYPQIHQEALDTVNAENPGLYEKSQKLKAWIYHQINT